MAAALASIVDAILLRPLPVAHPEEVARVFTASEAQPLGFVSYLDFEDFRAAIPMVAECLVPVSVGDPPQIRMALAVTSDYFRILGVSARFGRTFSEEDHAAAILAHGSAADIGKDLRVAGRLYTIIGIAPENFSLDRFLHPDLFLPIRSLDDGKILEDRSRRFLTVHVRGLAQAARIASIAARLEQEHPETNRGRRAVVLDELTARLRTDKTMPPLAALLSGLALLILAIACANACGALLIRSAARSRDTALKLALGASRVRLLLASLRESGVIALLGCAAALPLAWVFKEALRRSVVLPSDFGISIAARIDWRIATLAAAAALVSTLLCGAVPSLVRINVWTALQSSRQGSASRARNVLAAIEVALAAALVSTGGWLFFGLYAASKADLGYRADHIAVMTFDPGQSGYSEARTRAFYRDLTDRVRVLPGVKGVALAQSIPLGVTGAQRQLRIGDREEMTVWMNIVTPEYFERLRIGFLRGRTFDDRDPLEAIVNEELAKRIGAGEKVRVAGRTVEVIGVVKTAKYLRWDEPPRPFLYLPYAQNYASRMTLHVESTGSVFEAARSPEVPMSDARMLSEYFNNGAMFALKAALRIAEMAGGGGLLLALAGLYGAVSSAVERRRREIAIRTALGARPGELFAMMVRQGMGIALIGTASGLIAAQCASFLLRGFVPGGWLPWAPAAAAILLAASWLACAIPAIRALRVDPAVVLRGD
jgi:putative ABC transport system permease protein